MRTAVFNAGSNSVPEFMAIGDPLCFAIEAALLRRKTSAAGEHCTMLGDWMGSPRLRVRERSER